MPSIKFPRFSRRKSAGNALEAGYEPANQGAQLPATEQEHHDDGTKVSGYGGGYGGAQRQNRGSGNTSGSGYSDTDCYASTGSLNRLSSSSTLPSADAPRSPVSTDDHTGGYTHSAAKSTGSIVTTTSTGSSQKRSVGGLYGPTSPRRGTMPLAAPPKIETSLDTTSLFGDDMFSFGSSKGSGVPPVTGGGIGAIPHTAPKLASTRIINTSDNHKDISPVPPPKSYDPIGTSPTNQRFSYAAYSNIYTSPAHMDGDRPATSESPYGWGTGNVDDLPPPIIPAASNNSPRNSRNLTPGQNLQTPSHSHSDSLSAPRQAKPGRQHPPRGGSSDSLGLKRSSAVIRRQSFPDEDEDAAVVAQAAAASHKNNMQQQKQPDRRSQTQQALPPSLQIGSAKGLSDKIKDRDSGWEETLASGSSSVNSYPENSSSGSFHDTRGTSPAMLRGNTDPEYKQTTYNSHDSTPKAKRPPTLKPIRLTDGDDMGFDESISASASLAAKYEDLEEAKPTNAPNKVMTPAQFERYRQEQDNQRRLSGKPFTESDNGTCSESEEESETERNKVALKQRQKQEAHLSVYRQQMMKITGSQPMEQPYNSRGGSVSASALPLPLNHSMPQLSLSGPGSSGKSSEEEDEEIPLGILMAHGFPNRARPPTRLSNASSQPNLRQAAMNQQDSRLPPFARNLPADPYNLSASIINPTNRMSLAYGVGSDQRSVGGSVYGGEIPGRRQPGGLIGEIVRTEEIKAARKGGGSTTFPPQKSPFMADPFRRPSSPGGGMLGLGGGMQPGHHGGMGMGGSMPGNMSLGMGPGMGMPGMQMPPPAQDPMQMQMANQMQQMMQMQMQMQMQWMQMNMQNPQQPQPMLSPPTVGQQRPMSMANSTSSSNFPMMPPHQRTMSMMEPISMMEPLPLFQRPGYAPSVAPSQRGQMPGGLMPSGYTPSIAPSERNTVGLPSRYRPVSYAPPGNAPPGARTTTLPSGAGQDWSRKGVGPSHLKNLEVDSDEDDESGWEALEKKRKEKRDGWKKKKETGELKGILNFGAPAGPSK